MAYTPELSQIGSAILRRLAWYMGKPITKSLGKLIELPAMKMAEVRPGEVCKGCRDDSICEVCPFKPHHILQKSVRCPGWYYLKGKLPVRMSGFHCGFREL